MCGRYTLVNLARLTDLFPWITEPPADVPRFNIAPSQPILAVANDDPDRYDHFLWGLIPSWAKDPKVGYRMINARGETLAEKSAYRTAFKRRRCLIPADGFYEWKVLDAKTKQPMRIRLRGDTPFALAGLWEAWHDEAGKEVRSATIITTQPNKLMAGIHDRMPAIVPASAHERWLDPKEHADATRDFGDLLAPYPAEAMEAYPVSRHVNSPRNEDADCIAPLDHA